MGGRLMLFPHFPGGSVLHSTADLINLSKEIWDEHSSLEPLQDRSEFHAFLASDLLLERQSRFNAATYRIDETSGLYFDEKVVPVHVDGEWSIILTTHKFRPALIYSNPFPSLIGPILAPLPVAFQVYSMGEPNAEVSVPSGYCEPLEKKVLIEGDFWSPPTSHGYMFINNPKEEIYLRIAGPPVSKYIHAYDLTTLRYTYTSYSHPRFTSRDFLARLIKSLSNSEMTVSSGGQEFRGDLVRLASSAFDDVSTPEVAKWALAQAVARFESGLADTMLRRLSESNDPYIRNAAQSHLFPLIS